MSSIDWSEATPGAGFWPSRGGLSCPLMARAPPLPARAREAAAPARPLRRLVADIRVVPGADPAVAHRVVIGLRIVDLHDRPRSRPVSRPKVAVSA